MVAAHFRKQLHRACVHGLGGGKVVTSLSAQVRVGLSGRGIENDAQSEFHR